MTFKFSQRVTTPKGEAVFIGYFTDGVTAQVSRSASVKEYSREECERLKPSVADMTAGEYETWRTNTHITVNEVYAVTDLSPAPEHAPRRARTNTQPVEPEPELETEPSL